MLFIFKGLYPKIKILLPVALVIRHWSFGLGYCGRIKRHDFFLDILTQVLKIIHRPCYELFLFYHSSNLERLFNKVCYSDMTNGIIYKETIDAPSYMHASACSCIHTQPCKHLTSTTHNNVVSEGWGTYTVYRQSSSRHPLVCGLKF